MVDLATLAIAIDSTQVKTGVAELDKLTSAGTRAEGSVDRLGDTAQQTGEQLRGAGRGAAEMAREAQRAAASSGSARQGMQQLGYQLNDVATMFASGSNAAQIFGSQLGQTIQAVQLMTGGTSRLATFLAGPWGIALSTAAIALSPFIGRLFESEGAAKDAANAYRTAAEEARGLAGAMNSLQLAQKYKELNDARSRSLELEIEIEKRGVRNPATGQLQFVYKQQQELQKTRWQIVELENVTKLAEEQNEKLTASMNRGSTAAGSMARSVRQSVSALKEQAVAAQSAADAIIEQTRASIKETGLAQPASIEAGLKRMQDRSATAAQAATDAIKATANANAEWNDRLRETINLLDGLGGAGSTLANIGAIFEAIGSGEWRNVRGPAAIIGQGLFTSVDKDGKRFINDFGLKMQEVLDGVFGKDGSFVKIFAGLAESMATSSAVTSLADAVGIKLNKTGSQIGAAIGKMTGIPGADLVGAVWGGVIGKIFSTTKKGYAVVTNNGITSGGNSRMAESSAASGAGVQGAIQSIADQLGGTVGNYSVSIGKRSSGWIRVSASGSSQVADKNFHKSSDAIYNGKDEAEALRVAVLNAIRDGAIQGVRAGTQALLSKDGDIEAQLAKALKFEGVFTSLKAELDPLGAALDDINKRFTDLRAIFTEAGASAAEFAQLEQLLAIERAKAAEQAQGALVDRVRDSWNLEVKLLDLLGKNESALAASRLLELASMKATLQPLQAMIYQLEDAQGIIEKFGPLADDLKKFRAELLGGGDATGSFGFVQAQFRSTAAAAAMGDATALGGLRSAANTYLTSARNNAGSALDYQRALGEVLTAVDKGIFAADTQVDYAQAQIDAINNSANIMERMRSELVTLQGQIAVDSETMRKLLQRFENDGVTISDATAPLQVQVVS